MAALMRPWSSARPLPRLPLLAWVLALAACWAGSPGGCGGGVAAARTVTVTQHGGVNGSVTLLQALEDPTVDKAVMLEGAACIRATLLLPPSSRARALAVHGSHGTGGAMHGRSARMPASTAVWLTQR